MVAVAGDTDKTFLLPLSASCDLEEVVVVAGEECLLPQFTSTNSKVEEKRRYTVEEAKRIRGHQGNHEAEVSCGGEGDLHQHYTSCQKNPGHGQFVPVEDFKKKHLPPGYRDNVIVDWIRAEADLTCRLSSNYTSESRPEFFPDSQDPYPFYQDRGGDWLRTGTGCVSFVHKYTEKDNKECECDECKTPGMHTPKKVWGEVVIVTASHLVFNGDEASRTFCHFFYDTSITDISQCPTLRGLKVECSDIQGDMCMMTCVTHDMALVDKLVKMCDRRLKVFEKVRVRYWLDEKKSLFDPCVSRVTDPTPDFVVVISHPHGCNKQISFGEWTRRQTEGKKMVYKEGDELKAECISSSYKYNAATCWGSSGAPVIRLLEKGRVGWWWLLYSHPHSGGDSGNNNYSGMMEEFVSFPPTVNDKFSKSALFKSVLFNFVVSMGYWIFMLMVVLGTSEIAAYLWVPACLMMIVVMCYWLIPCCKVWRWFYWFLVIYPFFIWVLYCFTAFVLSIIYDDCGILWQVVFGFIFVACFLFFFLLCLNCIIADQFTSVKIQRRLRQRTRTTKETATKLSENNMVTNTTNDNNNNSNNNSDTSTTVITTITISNENTTTTLTSTTTNNNNNNNDNNYNTNTNTTTNNNNNNDNKYVSFQRLTHTRI